MDARSSTPVPSPRERLERALNRILHPHPLVLETRRPVEVPVLTETKRLWTRGQRAESVRYAYVAVLHDVQRAYHVEFPSDWTHQDILERGVTPEMGPIPDFLVQLLNLYEPIRYSTDPPGDLASPVPLVESLYSPLAMWSLYLAEVPHVPPAVPGSPAVTPPASTTGNSGSSA